MRPPTWTQYSCIPFSVSSRALQEPTRASPRSPTSLPRLLIGQSLPNLFFPLVCVIQFDPQPVHERLRGGDVIVTPISTSLTNPCSTTKFPSVGIPMESS